MAEMLSVGSSCKDETATPSPRRSGRKFIRIMVVPGLSEVGCQLGCER